MIVFGKFGNGDGMTGVAEVQGFNRLIADRFAWVCAVWIHLALFALLSNLAAQHLSRPASPDPISVEILYQPPFPAFQEPSNTSPAALSSDPQIASLPPASDTVPGAPSTPLPNSETETASEDDGPGWVKATSLYGANVLNDPRSREAREMLSTLAGRDQADQLCALEAMEQVRNAFPGFRPTRLAPHAFRNSYREGDMIHAPAAALRSNRIWYEISYRCALDPGGRAVTGIEYALGKEIKRALWDEHGLAPIH